MESQWRFIFQTWAWQANFTCEEYKQYKDGFFYREDSSEWVSEEIEFLTIWSWSSFLKEMI